MRGPRSAGILPFRLLNGFEVLIAHPGGPYFSHRDSGWWSLVKGLVKVDESDKDAARREFEEELAGQCPRVYGCPWGNTAQVQKDCCCLGFGKRIWIRTHSNGPLHNGGSHLPRDR